MNKKQYHIYMVTNQRHTVLYTGMTSNLLIRTRKHKTKFYKGFTQRYNVDKLVYFEEYETAYDAITREKQLKSWTQRKKEALINRFNPKWKDLFYEWIP